MIKSMQAAILLFLAVMFSFSVIATASAARVYNADTNKWEESTARRGNAALANRYARKVVDYESSLAVGSIVVDNSERWLYLIQGNGKALRYGVGVGRKGFQWRGTHRISRKAEWPGWTPPAAMRKRQPGLPAYMPGGPDNPLGARAMYIGSTLYRLHGTSDPYSIGQAVSSGCIRLMNDDVIDLYDRVRVGALVVVKD